MSKVDGNNGPKEQQKTVDPSPGSGGANGKQPAVNSNGDSTNQPRGNGGWTKESRLGELANNPSGQLSSGQKLVEFSADQLANDGNASARGPNAAAGEGSGTETMVPTTSKPKAAGEDQRLDTATETEVKRRLRATQQSTQFQSGKFYQLDTRGQPQKLSSDILFDPGSTTTGEGESKGEPDGVRPSDSASQVQSQTSSQRKPPEPIGSMGNAKVYSARLHISDSVSQVQSQISGSWRKPPEPIGSVGSTRAYSARLYRQQRDDEREENQRLRAENERLRVRLLDIQAMQQESGQDVAARNVELDDELRMAEEEIFRLTDRNDELERLAEDCKRQVEAIAEDCGRLDQENTELKRQLTVQTQQTLAPSSELAKTCQLAQQKASCLQQEMAHKDQTIRGLEQKIREAEQDSIRANRGIDMREGQLMEKDAELRQIDLQLKEAKRRLESYSELATEFGIPFNAQRPPVRPDLKQNIIRDYVAERGESTAAQDIPQETGPPPVSMQSPVTASAPPAFAFPSTSSTRPSHIQRTGISEATRIHPPIGDTRVGYQAASSSFHPPTGEISSGQRFGQQNATNRAPPPIGESVPSSHQITTQQQVSSAPGRSVLTSAQLSRVKLDIPAPDKLDVTKGQASIIEFHKWKKKLRAFFELSGHSADSWPKFVPWYLAGYAEENVRAYIEKPENAEIDFEGLMAYIEAKLLHKSNAAVVMMKIQQLSYDKRRYTLNEFLQTLMERHQELNKGEPLEETEMRVIKNEFLQKLPQGYQDFITWHEDWESRDVYTLVEWADHYENRQDTREYLDRNKRKPVGGHMDDGVGFRGKWPIGRNPPKLRNWDRNRGYTGGRQNFRRRPPVQDRRDNRPSIRDNSKDRDRDRKSDSGRDRGRDSSTPRAANWREGRDKSRDSNRPRDRDRSANSRTSQGNRSNRSSQSGSANSQPRDRLGPCYNCNEYGHLAKQCPRNKKPFSRPRVNAVVADYGDAYAQQIAADHSFMELFEAASLPVDFGSGPVNYLQHVVSFEEELDYVTEEMILYDPRCGLDKYPTKSSRVITITTIDAEENVAQIDHVETDDTVLQGRPSKPLVIAEPRGDPIDNRLRVEGIPTTFKMDCGASATLLPKWLYEDLTKDKGQQFIDGRTQPSQLTLRTYDGTAVTSIKQLVLELDDGKRRSFVPCMIDSGSTDHVGREKSALLGVNAMAALGYRIVDSEDVQIFPDLETELRCAGVAEEFEERFGHLGSPVSESVIQLDVKQEDLNRCKRAQEIRVLVAMEAQRRKRFSKASQGQMPKLECDYWISKLAGAKNPRNIMEEYWRQSHRVQTQTGQMTSVKREKPEPIKQARRNFAATTELLEMSPSPKKRANWLKFRRPSQKKGSLRRPAGVMYPYRAPRQVRSVRDSSVNVPLKERQTVSFQEIDAETKSQDTDEPDEKGFCPVELAETTEFIPSNPDNECQGAGRRRFVPMKAVNYESQLKRHNNAFRFRPLNVTEKQGIYFADAVVIPDEFGYFSVEAYNSNAYPVQLDQFRLGYLQEVDLDVPIQTVAEEMTDMLYNPETEASIVDDELFILETRAEKRKKKPPDIRQLDGPKDQMSREQLLRDKLVIDGKGATPEEVELIRDTLISRSKAFALTSEELGKTDLYQHDIQLDSPDQVPINQKCRRLPYAIRAEITKEIEKLLKLGIIRPSDSDWASPIVPVRKKTGEIRMCIDYRILNGVSRKDNSPLPNINDLLDEAGLNKSKWFSAIDLMMGYHQVGMTERAQRYSAFVSHLGQFTYLRMPFGLCNAPATFSNLMRKVQATLQRNRILVYMDDILVTTPTVAEHARQLAKLCDRLVEVGLTIKPEKSIFLKQEVLYLGFIVSASGVKADPTKLKAMREYARPVTPKDVRSFLGLCSYYRRFVKGFAQIVAPLHAALQGKPEKLTWTSEMEEAFKALKRSLTTPPVLAYPQMGKPYFLFTDASRTGLGCVLKQKDDKGRLHPIAYGSRSLSKEEKNYGVTDLEASAVIYGIEHFDVYIRSQDCTIVVDHKALKDILLSKGNLANDRQIRWRNRFMGTNFKIKYTKGANQVVADTLSRYPWPGSEPTEDHPTDCDPYDDLTEIAVDYGENTEPIGSNIPHDVPLETEISDSIESTLLCDHTQVDTLAGNDLGAKRLALALDPISPVKYDTKQVRAAQKRDRFFQRLFDYLENEKLYGPIESRNYLRKFARDCEVLDGVLYYGRSGNPEELRVAVPTDMRWELLKDPFLYLGRTFCG